MAPVHAAVVAREAKVARVTKNLETINTNARNRPEEPRHQPKCDLLVDMPSDQKQQTQDATNEDRPGVVVM